MFFQFFRIFLILQVCLFSLEAFSESALFFQNLSKKINKNPSMAAKICNKRLAFEISDKRFKYLNKTYQKKKLDPKRTLFFEKLISFCVNEVMPKSYKKDRITFRENLVKFVGGIISRRLLNYDKAFLVAINYIYSKNDNFVKQANNNILKSLTKLTNLNDFTKVYKVYLTSILEKIILQGNLNISNKFIDLIKFKNRESKEIKLDLEMTTARLLTLHGKFLESKSLYEKILKDNEKTNNRSVLIAKIEYASTLRSLEKNKESMKVMLSIESGLESNASDALKAWFFLEKSQLDFEVNKNFKSANKLLKKSENFYLKSKRTKNLYFVHLKRAEFFRRLGSYRESKSELKNAASYLKNYQNSPMYLFEYYYQLAITDFYLKKLNALSKTINKINGIMFLTAEASKYSALLAPLKAFLKNDKSLLSAAIKQKNKYQQNPLKNRDIDRCLDQN